MLFLGEDTGGKAEHLSQAGFRARAATAERSPEDDELTVPDAAEAPAGTPALPRLESLTPEFDCISVSGFLEHIQDRNLLEVLYHLRRLLSPIGILILSVPDPAEGLELESAGRLPGTRAVSLLSLATWAGCQPPRARTSEGQPEAGAVAWCAGVHHLRLPRRRRPGPAADRDARVHPGRGSQGQQLQVRAVRALANLAIHRYNAVDWLPDGRVALPWKLIADEWIAYYWPIVEADVISGAGGSSGPRPGSSPAEGPAILQGQKIRGKSDFAFRAGLTELAGRFAGAGGYAAFSRSRDAGRLSAEVEALYRQTMSKLKDAISQPVQYAGNERTTKGLFELAGDHVLLPGALWSELSVMGRWVIDSISLRWADFTAGLRHQTPGLTREAVLALILPADNADRDVALAQAVFDRQRERSSDGRIECVWSGERVSNFDVDHAIPFSLWGNNDLWNLLPAAPAVNNAKRAKLPERAVIERRRHAIVEAWEMLYESERGLFLAHAGSFTGHSWGDFSRREEDELFSTFKDAVEYTARNRVAERWAG